MPVSLPAACPIACSSWLCAVQTALQLTEAQQVDLMHLRRLFYARLGALARERKQLLQQLPVTGASTSAPEASSRLADVRTIAQQLQDNSCLEFRMYLQLTSASRRGVSHSLLGFQTSHT